METIAIEKKNKSKQQFGTMIQRLLRNRVYIGIKEEHLKRKVYRGKRNDKGKRGNEVFYVNSDQTFRIEESFLIESINLILIELQKVDNCNLDGWSEEGRKSFFNLHHSTFIHNQKNLLKNYQDFITEMIEEIDEQPYRNMALRKKIESGKFEDIIEKIEIYETGILCIFNNGFEMSLRF
ncbi:hypothetical protein [Anaerorhabdus sp.]|uniref:hypothetical protein n=1 Tax=Anaerorhabdus sp. TaxID=1872524 RepID=UPI002FCC117C